MRPIRNSALGAGVVSGVVFYACIRIALQITPPWIALDLIAALGGGLLLGVCYYIFGKLALRRAVGQLRDEVAPLVGAALPPFHADELEELRQTYDRAVKTLMRLDRYSAITDQLLSSDDSTGAFRVIAEHAARTLPIDGAALFLHEGAWLRAAAAWNLERMSLPETEQDSALWRALHEDRPVLLNHADALGASVGIRAAALLVVPLDVSDRPVGVLALANRTNPEAFDEDQLAQARFFASQAALAVRQKRFSDAARDAQNKLAAVYQASRDLSDNLALDEVLRRALAAAAALTASSHATVLLLDSAGERITHRIALDSGNMAPLDLVARPMMRQGLAGWVVRERRPALVRDTEQDARWLPGPGLGDMRSALAAPLLRGDRALGVMTLAHDAPDHYTADHLQLLEALSAQAALAIESARVGGAGDQRAIEHADTQAISAGHHGAEQESRAARMPAANQDAPEPPMAHHVMAVFADMRGFAGASERLSPEVLVKDVLDVYMQAMTEAIQRYAGYVEKCSDDGVLAIFGHPENRPDDALRAVQAALAIRQAGARLRTGWRARLGVDLGVAVGIGRGNVAVGRVGSPARHEYAVIGDAVNVASRLQGLARPGEILAAAEVIEALNGASAGFDVEPLPPLPIDDQESVRYIYRIGGRTAKAERSARPHQQARQHPDS